MALPVFNSKEFAWKNIVVVFLGRPIINLLEIKYKVSMEKEPLYGAGQDPTAIQHGNRKVEGSVKVRQSELEALNRFAKSQGYSDVLDLDFDIIVTYMEVGSAALITDVIKFASITDYEKGMKQNDKAMEVDLPFLALSVA